MANNPLDVNAFRHYLIFTSLGRTDLYEIAEPISFDASNFVVKQESKRYARSISYGAIEKLTFVDAFGVDTGVAQTINPQGDQSTHLDYGLQWILSIYKDYGFESKIEYILEKDGVQFSNGMLDFTDKDITDGYTYVTTKLIQKNKVANLKRRLDDKFNVFSDKNVNQETITPAPTLNVLLKATPLTLDSKFELPQSKNLVAGRFGSYNNYSAQITQSLIPNTLTFFDTELFSPTFVSACNNFRVIQAQNDLSRVTVKMNSNIIFNYDTDGGSGSSIAGSQLIGIVFEHPLTLGDLDPSMINILTEKYLSGTTPQTYTFPNELTFELPDIPRGYSMALFWIYSWQSEHIDETSWNFSKCDFTITATSTAIPIVTKTVRWIDVIKQASKFTDALTVNASAFDVGGEHYNNVCFNRRMISQKIDNFTLETKKAFESVEEINCDYEPDEDGIFIGHQSDYYTNNEIGVFNIIPAEDFTIEENDRHQINKLKYAYKTFEQDRTSQGTSNAIHTDSEFTLLNQNVENVKDLKIEFVRDPLAIQEVVNLEIQQPTTSTNEDDKVYITNITALAPSSFNEFGARLLMRIVDGKLEILNRDSNGDSSNVVINWAILGFNVGSTFQITFGENIGNYNVTTITTSVLTLTPIAFTPTFEGDAFIRVKYFYTDVLWTSRTTEGFISNPLALQNVAYSIKRNILRFGEYLASCLLYARKDIFNAYFKSNGTYSSQLIGEANPIIENATILYDSLPNPLTTAKVYNLTCVAEFNDVLNYLEAYKVSRGFIRAYDSYGRVIKGYVQELDHTWASNMLKLTLEEKFETENLILTYADGVLTVNDVVYDLGGNSEWWRADNEYFKFYDANSIPLSNFYRFNFIELNGITYESKEDLINALINL